MWKSIRACIYLYLVNLVVDIDGITYLKGVPTPKWTTRMIPLSKWLEDNDLRLAPYGNQEFTKIFRQYKHVIRAKYFEDAPENMTESSLGGSDASLMDKIVAGKEKPKYVQSLFFTSTTPKPKKLLKKDKIKLGKMKLIKENLQKLEERLGLTTTPEPTTTEPSTEPYTGPSTRRTMYSSFDPDYIFDVNWPLKNFKRLKREVSDMKNMDIEKEVSFHKENNPNLIKRNSVGSSNALNIFPFGHLTRKEHLSENQRWFETKPEEFRKNMQNENEKNVLKLKETKLLRFRRQLNYIMSVTSQPDQDHVIVRRDLGKIIRRTTRRPHLSRQFKAQSMKRYLQDCRLENMFKRMAANITIVPQFLMMKSVWDDCARMNLSTVFYVYNNVAYFASLPPDLFSTTKAPESSTKLKAVTFELGATHVLGANIFENEGKRVDKVSPGDVDIPNIDLGQQAPISKEMKESKNEGLTETTEPLESDTTKLKRTRKKKSGDKTGSGSDVSKKTRAKRKSTQSIVNNTKSLENSLEQEVVSSNKGKPKKRKARNVDLRSENLVLETLPAFLCLIHQDMHLRRKRNINDQEETKHIEDQSSKLGHFGKLKDKIKRSKNKIASFVKEKKESLIDMPRRARYIAREMYLDGKFFFQELKEVPDRIKKDFNEKKELFNLLWDMLKIFMPATTAVGEKGGTTPETKIVDDPKQYVKNVEDYVTPDLSDLNPIKTSVKEENLKEKHLTKEQTSTLATKTTLIQPERSTYTVPSPSHRDYKELVRTTSAKTTSIEKATIAVVLSKKEEAKSTIDSDDEPILITDEPSTEKVYNTRVVGPDYIPSNTRLDEDVTNLKTSRRPVDKIDLILEKVNDDKVFDKMANTMKDKDFMDKVLKNADTDRLKNMMSDVQPQDMLSRLDQKTIHKMGKLMAELEPDTIKQMQDLVMRTTNFSNSGKNEIKKTR